MKKLLCLVLALSMLCLWGCGTSKDDASSQNQEISEVQKAAESGKLSASKFGLGASPKEVKEHYKKLSYDYKAAHKEETEEDHIHSDEKIPFYDLDLKGKYTEIDVADCRFYYENKNEDKGIVAIATDADVLGFKVGITTKQEVENSVGKKGETFNATKDEEIFLAVSIEDLMIFRVEYTDALLDFYFYDNTLVNTVLKSTK